MRAELWNLAKIGRYPNVSAERARQVAASDPTFPAPATEGPRRWSRSKVECWAERHWWDTLPWRPGASLGYLATKDLKAIAERLGHTSTRMVDSVYVGLYANASVQVAEAIDKLARKATRRA